MNHPHRHLAPLVRIALLVAAGDYATKAAAARWVSLDSARVGQWLHFAVVHNTRAAFGLSLGAYTQQLNLALTLAAILFVIPVSRDLARLDREAPWSLGLIVGGALGNFASLVLSPRGVIDFIAIDTGHSEFVLNVADVATYVGLAMLVRTGFLIVAALRRDMHPRVHPHAVRQAPVLVRLARDDEEIARHVFREPLQVIEPGNSADRFSDPTLAEAAYLASTARILNDDRTVVRNIQPNPSDAPTPEA